MQTVPRLALTLLLMGTLSACSLALRNPSVADLQQNPVRYHDRTVTVQGVVTTAWGLPLVPFRLYRINDGTGELTVISQSSRTPTRGSRVRVRGRVNELGVIGGRPLGLHIREHRLDVLRRQ